MEQQDNQFSSFFSEKTPQNQPQMASDQGGALNAQAQEAPNEEEEKRKQIAQKRGFYALLILCLIVFGFIVWEIVDLAL